jgi:hypothetical protein
MRIFAVMFIAVFALGFTACKEPTDGGDPNDPGSKVPGGEVPGGEMPGGINGCTISGTITADNPAGALSGASVKLKQGGTTKNSATSAANGTYSFSGVADGTYSIEVSKSGYHDGAIHSVVVSGADLPNQNIELINLLTPTYSVSGTITGDDALGGLEGAVVVIKQGSMEIRDTTTAANGTYTLNYIPDGTYTIEVSKAGYRSETIPDVIVSGANVTGKNLQLVNINALELARIASYLASNSGTLVSPLSITVESGFDLGVMTSATDGWQMLLGVIETAGDYVNLDLTGCAMDGTAFNPDDSVSAGKSYIVSITLPYVARSIVNRVVESAFFYFNNIKTVSAEKMTNIGRGAFDNRTTLTSINFPAVTSIDEDAFFGCTGLTSVSFPMAENIGDRAFADCTGLTSVSFPMAENIGDRAFYNCTSLTAITSESFPVAKSIGEGAFEGCNNLTSVNFPAVENLGGAAFKDCRRLASVSFPAVVNIASSYYSPFDYCSALTSVSFPSAKNIGDYTFCIDLSYGGALTSVSFPVAESIGYMAFDRNVRSITLPANVDVGIQSMYGFSGEQNFKTFYDSYGKLAGTYTRSGSVGAYSWTRSGSPPLPPQDPPTGLFATPSDISASPSIYLQWYAAGDGTTSYRIERSTSPNSGFSLRTTVTTTSYTDTGLEGNTTYYYRVYSMNSGGTSASYASVSATTAGAIPTTRDSRLVAKWYPSQEYANANTGEVYELTSDGRLLLSGYDAGISWATSGSTIYAYTSSLTTVATFSISGTALTISNSDGYLSNGTYYKRQ